MRFELTTPTLARLCSTPELRPLNSAAGVSVQPLEGERYDKLPLQIQG